MALSREQILNRLKDSLAANKPIIGVSVGAGISAKYAEKGGADIILAQNSGKFRQMGLSSLAGMMPFRNSNRLVLEFGQFEILRVVKQVPVVFGLCAQDPEVDLESFTDYIHEKGFSGVNNFPTVGIIDGQYREALEESGEGFINEVKAIEIANKKNIFTVAFVFNAKEAEMMVEAGADVICAHLGFTRGGALGVKSYLSFDDAAQRAQRIFDGVNSINKDIIKLIYGGPVKSADDAEFFYNKTDASGYIGGSSFERIPMEDTIIRTTKQFKNFYDFTSSDANKRKHSSYVFLIKKYISEHYSEKISFSAIADELHLSRNYLSYLFKKEMGCTFTSYLNKYRIHKAMEILRTVKPAISQVAEMTGFNDQAYFSRTFKRITGMSPTDYCNML